MQMRFFFHFIHYLHFHISSSPLCLLNVESTNSLWTCVPHNPPWSTDYEIWMHMQFQLNISLSSTMLKIREILQWKIFLAEQSRAIKSKSCLCDLCHIQNTSFWQHFNCTNKILFWEFSCDLATQWVLEKSFVLLEILVKNNLPVFRLVCLNLKLIWGDIDTLYNF